MLERNKKIGEYILIEFIGSGGYGDVWKAEKRTKLSVSEFALKFFRPKNKEEIDLEKVKREVQTGQKLNFLPNIISVIEADVFENYVYIVSDYADGGSLQEWLNKEGGKAESQEQAIEFTLDILEGLNGLHKSGYVHRDIKPDNILIRRNICCLADFGITREIKSHSKATVTAGTFEYMPPEAFEKPPSVSPQTDIWAVGVILQKLLTGNLPYPQDNIPSLMAAILYDEPEPMPEEIPLGLREIVKKALQKDRKDRFKTAQEMTDALKNPEMFLAQIRTVEEEKKPHKPTIIDEDFDKPEELKLEKPEDEEIEIPPLEDRQKIEAEKQEEQERHRKEEEAKEIKRKELEEKSFWQKVRNANTIEKYEEYIRLYPEGKYKDVCERKIAELETEKEKQKQLEQEEQKRLVSAKDYFDIALAYQESREYDRAIENYTKAIELNPNFATAYYDRGKSYVIKHEYDKAIKDLNRAIELNPEDANLYYFRGSIHHAVKDNYDQAVIDYRKALEIEPNHGSAKENLKRILKKKSDPEEKKLREYQRQIRYEQIIKREKRRKRFLTYALGLLGGIILITILSIVYIRSSNSAQDYFEVALVCVVKRNYNCAIENYTKAIELNPTFVDAYYYRGMAHSMKSEYDLAIKDYNKTIELNPNVAKVYSSRGDTYLFKTDYDQALKEYNKAIELNPNLAETYSSRGGVYFLKWKLNQAIEDYNKAIELNPDYAEAYNGRGYAYDGKGEYDKAIADYRKALEIKPDYKLAKDNLERALKKKNNK